METNTITEFYQNCLDQSQAAAIVCQIAIDEGSSQDDTNVCLQNLLDYYGTTEQDHEDWTLEYKDKVQSALDAQVATTKLTLINQLITDYQGKV